MTEGGLLDWKIQKVKENGPSVDYSKLSQPLIPPKGMCWHKDKEWTLIPVAEAIPLDTNNNKSPDLKKDAVKGVDYIEHFIQPTDTFQGICLTYKISATKLRQTNLFSGTNLKLAPSPLIIPMESKETIDAYSLRKTNYDSNEGKVHEFLAQFFPKLGKKEAKLYVLYRIINATRHTIDFSNATIQVLEWFL